MVFITSRKVICDIRKQAKNFIFGITEVNTLHKGWLAWKASMGSGQLGIFIIYLLFTQHAFQL